MKGEESSWAQGTTDREKSRRHRSCAETVMSLANDRRAKT